MRFIADYIIIFLLFGAVVYLLLPRLTKRHLTQDIRLQKTLWASLLFTAAKFILDHFVP